MTPLSPTASGGAAVTPEIAKAVIRVGDGRGFVVEHNRHRFVITAAHCLPYFPPCHGASYLDERTYEELLGPIGAGLTVWAECLFADPIADLAILGRPDDQILVSQAERYDALTEDLTPFVIGDAPQKVRAWLLSLDGDWFECFVTHRNGPIWIRDSSRHIEAGMSGSPILAEDGTAIGVLTVSAGINGGKHTEGGPNPRLFHNLPNWILI